MIESGRVVAIESDALWVETLQKTTCGSCALQKGCGQSILQQLYSARANHLRVQMTDSDPHAIDSVDPYRIGDRVEFSLPDHIIVTGSLLLYLVPIVGLLLGSVLGAQLFAHEPAVIVSAMLGFCIAAAAVRLFSMRRGDGAALQAQLIGHVQTSSTTTSVLLQANAS